jgi:hypothetical protein
LAALRPLAWERTLFAARNARPPRRGGRMCRTVTIVRIPTEKGRAAKRLSHDLFVVLWSDPKSLYGNGLHFWRGRAAALREGLWATSGNDAWTVRGRAPHRPWPKSASAFGTSIIGLRKHQSPVKLQGFCRLCRPRPAPNAAVARRRQRSLTYGWTARYAMCSAAGTRALPLAAGPGHDHCPWFSP